VSKVNLTNLKCVDARGRPVPFDASGGSVAFSCPRCSHPVLASTGAGQRGSSPDQPATCPKCRFDCWVEAHADALHLYSRSLA